MADRVLIRAGLQLQLLVARVGGLALLAIALSVVAVAGHFAVLPKLQELIEANFRAQAVVRAQPAESHLAQQVRTRYDEFRLRLAPLNEHRNHLKALFKEAADSGVSLSQGDYRLQPDSDCNCQALQITLPIRGTYPQIRAFVDAALAKIPPLSLDEISFRRENVKSPVVEAQLRLTLYLKEAD